MSTQRAQQRVARAAYTEKRPSDRGATKGYTQQIKQLTEEEKAQKKMETQRRAAEAQIRAVEEDRRRKERREVERIEEAKEALRRKARIEAQHRAANLDQRIQITIERSRDVSRRMISVSERARDELDQSSRKLMESLSRIKGDNLAIFESVFAETGKSMAEERRQTTETTKLIRDVKTHIRQFFTEVRSEAVTGKINDVQRQAREFRKAIEKGRKGLQDNLMALKREEQTTRDIALTKQIAALETGIGQLNMMQSQVEANLAHFSRGVRKGISDLDTDVNKIFGGAEAKAALAVKYQTAAIGDRLKGLDTGISVALAKFGADIGALIAGFGDDIKKIGDLDLWFTAEPINPGDANTAYHIIIINPRKYPIRVIGGSGYKSDLDTYIVGFTKKIVKAINNYTERHGWDHSILLGGKPGVYYPRDGAGRKWPGDGQLRVGMAGSGVSDRLTIQIGSHKKGKKLEFNYLPGGTTITVTDVDLSQRAQGGRRTKKSRRRLRKSRKSRKRFRKKSRKTN